MGDTRSITDDSASRIGRELKKIRDALVSLLKQGPETAGPAGRILESAGEIESIIGGGHGNAAAGHSEFRQSGTHRRGATPKRYLVEKVGDAQFLVEHRPNSRAPFRVPREVFEAVVRALSGTAEWRPFDEIHRQVAQIVGGTPSEYQTRVCLRFLSSAGVGLAQRHRARYAALDPERLSKKASTHWSKLAGGKGPRTRKRKVSG